MKTLSINLIYIGYPTTAEHTFWNTLFKCTWDILHDGPYFIPKLILNKFKRIEIIYSMFSNYSRIILEIRNKKIFGKFPGIWKFDNTLLNKPRIKKKKKFRETRKCFDLNDNKNILNLSDATKVGLRVIYTFSAYIRKEKKI